MRKTRNAIKTAWLTIGLLLAGTFDEIIAQVNRSEQLSLESYCECEDIFTLNDSVSKSNNGLAVLRTGYEMAMINKVIIKGSCWDFVNEVYKRAGFQGRKETIFKSKKSGPFATPYEVKAGDWIYHVNRQFNDIEHSAIFVCWKNFKKRIAITLSYSGRSKNVPARFGEYDLSKIYSIFRPL